MMQRDGAAVRWFYYRCGRWSCTTCARLRLHKLRARIASGHPEKHLVLTCSTHVGKNRHERAQLLVKSWDLMLKRIAYHWKRERLSYFWVMEEHKTGEPHLHILLRAPYIEQAWLSEQWEDLTGASNVWIEQVRDPENAVSYISKYIAKAPFKFEKVRRYASSRDWVLRKPLKPSNKWKHAETRMLHNVDIVVILKFLGDSGYPIIRAGPGGLETLLPSATTSLPFWNAGVTPNAFPKRRTNQWSELDAA